MDWGSRIHTLSSSENKRTLLVHAHFLEKMSTGVPLVYVCVWYAGVRV